MKNILRIPEDKKGVVALILLAWVFATMGVFARYLGTSFELFEQTYLRIGIAFVLGIVIFGRSINFRKLATLPKKDVAVLIFRAICLYTGVVLFTEGLLHTKLGNASFVAALPLLPLFGYFLLKESLKLRTVLYILIGFAGILLIGVRDLAQLSFGYGEMMALLSVIAFDFSYVARRWHSDHLNDKESAVFMFAVGAVFLFISSIVAGETFPTGAEFTPWIIGTLIAAAIFNVLNLYLTNYGFKKVKVAVAGNILTLETVIALGYSVFLFHELPVAQELVGSALVLWSVWEVNKLES